MKLRALSPEPTTAAPTALTAELNRLLAAVSRSFYLSLAVVPASVRAQLGVAYLLARAADTIADTACLPRRKRAELLGELAVAVGRTCAGTERPGPLAERLRA